MSPLEQREYMPILPWDKFDRWVHAICVVTFDLEIGQAMEVIHPGHHELTEREKTSVCYLAFPDSNSGLMGDVQFHFRIRMCPRTSRQSSQCYKDYDASCSIANTTDAGYMYGYVYFRQVKDKTLKRGYFQKSVVMLSRLPLVSLFSHVMSVIAPSYFESGEASIEAACHTIDQWPSPCPGELLSLPLHGNVIKVRIPSRQDNISLAYEENPLDYSTSNSPIRIANPHELSAFPILASILPYINLLWELVLISEPIVVMATNPTTSANMVQTLVSLIAPLKFCCDFRPFFTIHDSEFKEFTGQANGPPNVILGVTNPFFAKTLHSWPHIIRLGEVNDTQKAKLSKVKTLKVVEHKPGVYTNYKPHLQTTDKNLVKKLLKGVQMERPVEVQSALIRRYLLELTQSFMIPLERYAASLMPLQKSLSPFKSIPSLRPFNPDEFATTLDSAGPQLTCVTKGDWDGLYKRFFKSPNFSHWFNLRHREMTRKVESLHIKTMSDVDLHDWVKDRREVEIVDMVLVIRKKASDCKTLDIPDQTRQKLESQLEFLLGTLPEDLRSVLRKT